MSNPALRSARLYVIVFLASACTLVLEIVAGRLLAPQLGVSIYTWTSIIGIVLAGISVGNYIGGRLADRFPPASTLGLTLLGASLLSFAVLALLPEVPPLPQISASGAAHPRRERRAVLLAELYSRHGDPTGHQGGL